MKIADEPKPNIDSIDSIMDNAVNNPANNAMKYAVQKHGAKNGWNCC